MKFRLLILFMLIISTTSFARGRKPAVEDFVGIEVDHLQVAPQGTESLYNLEQDLNKIEKQKNSPEKAPKAVVQPSESISMKGIVGVAIALLFPLSIWFLIMAHLKRKASLESASNLEVLEKYRREREKKSAESFKKAS